MTYRITITGEHTDGKKETLSFDRACSSAAEMLGHVASSSFKVRREVGQLKNGKPKTLLLPLETEGRYKVVSLTGGGLTFDEVKGWKV